MASRIEDGGFRALPSRLSHRAATTPAGRRPERPRYRGALTFAGVISLLTWAVFAVLDVAGYRETADMASLSDIIDTSTVVLAVVVALLCAMHWRLAAEPGDVAVTVGLLALGPLAIGFDNLVVPRLPAAVQDDRLLTFVAPVAFTLAVAAFAVALVVERVRPRSVVAGAAAVLMVAGVAAWQFTDVGDVLAGRREEAVTQTVESVGQVVVAAVVVALAAAFWRDGRRRHRTLHAWLALALVALAQSRLMLALTLPGGTLWLAGSRILRMEALLFLLMGVNRELQEGYTRKEKELRRSKADVQRMEVQRAAERQALEENRHDVRSALFAIGGVADLLNKAHDDLDAGTLEALTQALGAEVARLQTLVAAQEREEVRPFGLLEAVSPVLLLERSNGLDVTCNVNEGLTAVGRPKETAQVLRTLLDNARLYAPGSPVTVRGEQRGEWVVLLVEDHGPGVPADERKAIFERSKRGTTADGTPGSGLGLYVAARLMREQGGDIWVTDRTGGGASFVVSLPAQVDGVWPPAPRRHKTTP